jgi:hypothetical protein
MAFHWRRYPHHRFENHSLLAHGLCRSSVRFSAGMTCSSNSNATSARQSPAQLFTHLEPQGDPAAWEDIALDRKDSAAGSKNN